MSLLEIKDLYVSYGLVSVVKNVSMEVAEGQMVSLLGSNGVGKSTTIKTISGLVKAKAGKVMFDGTDITHMEPHKIVSMGLVQVPEGRKLFGDMTVRENLEMGSYAKSAKASRARNLEFVFEMLPDLKMKEHDLARSLSGGQQQMVAIGRGMMANPKLIVFDEPSIGLSPLLTNTMFEIIKKIKDTGVSILLVEQNIRQSLSLANYAYVMELGEIVLEGNAKDVLENPHLKKAYLGM